MEKEILKKKKMVLHILLAALTSANLTACSSDEELLEVPSIEDMAEDFLEEDVLEEVEEKEENKFISIPSVIANDSVNIRISPVDGEIIGKLVKGHTLEKVEALDNGWYKVNYYDQEAYVSGDYTSEIDIYRVNREIKEIRYVLEEQNVELTIPEEFRLDKDVKTVILPSFERIEIYEELEDVYLVQTEDYIGYVSKTNLEKLTGALDGVFVDVDISDQELKLYENDEVILRTPVITGKPSTPTYEGLFSIYNLTYNRYLISSKTHKKTYFVEGMLKFNGNIGFHDAEKAEDHTCDNGKGHGWRNYAEFGGDTWQVAGSNGCVNMRTDDFHVLDSNVEEKTLVLVHK